MSDEDRGAGRHDADMPCDDIDECIDSSDHYGGKCC